MGRLSERREDGDDEKNDRRAKPNAAETARIAAQAKKAAEKSEKARKKKEKEASGRRGSVQVEEDENDEAWKCEVCKNLFDRNNDKVLECEFCLGFFCTTCLEMPAGVYKFISGKKDRAFWCCESCCPEVRSAIDNRNKPDVGSRIDASMGSIHGHEHAKNTADETVKEIKLLIEDFRTMIKTNRMTPGSMNEDWPALGETCDDDESEPKEDSWSLAVRRKNKKGTIGVSENAAGGSAEAPGREQLKAGSFKGLMKDAIAETAREAQIIEERAKNFIIYRAPEPTQSERKLRLEADKSFVSKFLEEIDAENIEIEEVTRLGKYDAGKARPLRVIVKDTQQKTDVMNKLRNLRQASPEFRNVAVNYDLTVEQRNKRKALILEAKQRTEESTEEHFLYRVINLPGPYWDPKITKVRRREKDLRRKKEMLQTREPTGSHEGTQREQAEPGQAQDHVERCQTQDHIEGGKDQVDKTPAPVGEKTQEITVQPLATGGMGS